MVWFQNIYTICNALSRPVQQGTIVSDPGSGKPGHPAKFAWHRDAQGRFQLGYPPGWDLKTDEAGVLARSKHIASFARVDVMPNAKVTWDAIESSARKLGGSLKITKELAGPPRHLRGRLELGGTQFDLRAWAWTTGKETVVLSTGNVVDRSRSTKVEKYEDRALAAIRREFQVPAPPEPPKK